MSYDRPTDAEYEFIRHFDWKRINYKAWDHQWMPWRLAKGLDACWYLTNMDNGKTMQADRNIEVVLVHAALVAGGRP